MGSVRSAVIVLAAGIGFAVLQSMPPEGAGAQKGSTKKPLPKDSSPSKESKPGGTDSDQVRADLEILVNYARSASPEFAADLLLRVAESDRVADRAWRQELIEDAFRFARDVQQPFKRLPLQGSTIDTRSGYLANALMLALDSLSLRCRAVKAMLLLDRRRAREMFTEIPNLKLKALTCEDPLVYDVGAYYSTLASVAKGTFTADETKGGEHVRFVQQYIEAVSSPAQVEPAAKVILALDLSDLDLESLIRHFAGPLGRISGDDRSFSVSWGAPGGAIESLAKLCNEKGVSGAGLVDAFRSYLVRHLTAARCSDTASNEREKSAESAMIARFNSHLRFAVPCKDVPPLSGEDTTPSKLEGSAKYHRYWQSSRAKDLITRFARLRFKPDRQPVTEEEKQEAEWQLRLSGFLADMASWTPADEASEEDFFSQKTGLFYGLVEIAPPGPTRERVLSELIELLNRSSLQKKSPIEWFQNAHRLFALAKKSGGNEGPKILQALSYGQSPVLYLYAEAQRLLGDI